jgi:hypothetical protein
MAALVGGACRALQGQAMGEVDWVVAWRQWHGGVGKPRWQWRSPRQEQEREKSESESESGRMRAAAAACDQKKDARARMSGGICNVLPP